MIHPSSPQHTPLAKTFDQCLAWHDSNAPKQFLPTHGGPFAPLRHAERANGRHAVQPPLPPIYPVLPLRVAILRRFMKALPSGIKRVVYICLCTLSTRWGWHLHPVVHHLPFGLALTRKASFSAQHSSVVEAAALKFLESSHIRGVNFPHLVDVTVDGEKGYMLSTYVDGDPLTSVLDDFTSQDWERLILDLRSQLRSLRQQTTCELPMIRNAAGSAIIDDPRISWVAENGRELATTQDFFSQVWLGLDLPRNIHTIRPSIQPLIECPVSVNFCHGDVYPRNMILPGGLLAWREGKSRLCLVDWEYSGWMPAPWEALKATFMECEKDSEWLMIIRKALPEFNEFLDADWEWRSKSNMMII